jgi:anti-sigma B factor antagonist
VKLHDDEIWRQQLIAAYLLRRLDDAALDEFEAHYLGCEECFQDLGAAELLVSGLQRRRLVCHSIGDVTLLRFAFAADLTIGSQDLKALSRNVLEQKDSNVIIDLSRVRRIDSTGLGELMRMQTHLIRGRGALKVLNPSKKVETMLRMTRIDRVVELYHEEQAAFKASGRPGRPIDPTMIKRTRAFLGISHFQS